MKVFDTYLQRAIRRDDNKDWSQYYINYSLLKQLLRSFLDRRQAWRDHGDIEFSTELMITEQDYYSNDINTDGSLQRLAFAEREEFVVAINQELQRSTSFIDHQKENLKSSLAQLRDNEITIQDVLAETLETFHFIVTNICTLRQILLRYNSFRRAANATSISESDVPLAPKLFDLKALAYMEASITLYLMSKHLEEELKVFVQQYSQFRLILDDSLNKVESARGESIVVADRMLSSSRQFLLKGSSRLGLLLEPGFLDVQGRNLKQEIRTLAQWRDTKLLSSKPTKLDPSNVWPLALNLVSCFLFMMNNYIVEPSSAYYANALGTSDALSGIMIGASAWFALISAVCYSFWTNTSYKKPIVFAGLLMISGNFLYSYAYSYKSMNMCLMGRAICGLGAPRVINRRYVADATPFALRTASSAAFAMMSALGAALGPGMAIILDLFQFEFNLPVLGRQYFNGMTGPGYFMAMMWLSYTILVLITFSEPKRSGLEELKRREEDFKTVFSADAEDDDDESIDTALVSMQESKKEESFYDSSRNCFKNMTKAAALCMCIIFMKRIALESIVASTSVVTKNRYSWTIGNVGTLHLINGLIVIPVSIFSGWISQYYEDRFMALCLIVISIFGMSILVDVTDFMDTTSNSTFNSGHFLAVGPARYVTGSLIAFSGIEACESFIASLMSKLVPSALAVGTFNSGLLITLVGTSGRATGDFFITFMGLISIRNLLNLLVIPGMGLMIISGVLIRQNYSILAV
jgi:hypothetical protein